MALGPCSMAPPGGPDDRSAARANAVRLNRSSLLPVLPMDNYVFITTAVARAKPVMPTPCSALALRIVAFWVVVVDAGEVALLLSAVLPCSRCRCS